MCGLQPLLKVPENVEVSMRQKEGTRVFFLLNHQNSPVRIQFYKPMHDFLTGNTFSGNYDLPPHGVLVLDEHPEHKISGGHRLICGLFCGGEFSEATLAALALLSLALVLWQWLAARRFPLHRRDHRSVLCAGHHPAQTAQRLRCHHRRIVPKLVQSKLCRAGCKFSSASPTPAIRFARSSANSLKKIPDATRNWLSAPNPRRQRQSLHAHPVGTAGQTSLDPCQRRRCARAAGFSGQRRRAAPR